MELQTYDLTILGLKRRYRPFVAYGTSKLMNILFTCSFRVAFRMDPVQTLFIPAL